VSPAARPVLSPAIAAAIERTIRDRVARFRARDPAGAALLDQGYATACLWYQGFLLDQLDDSRRLAAHTPAAPLRALPELTPATALMALPVQDARCDAARAAALAAARLQVDAALVAGIRAGDNPYALRQRAADAIAALERGASAPPPAPAPRPPDEPPPFTAG
jgi:hypothetical protein